MRRAASAIAILGFVAGLLGLVRAAIVLKANGGVGILALWMIVPLAAGGLTIVATRTRSVAFVWTTIGIVGGFVVLGALSLGLFFFFEALILFVAGVVHLPAIQPRWKLLTAPLWLVVLSLIHI